MDFLLKLAHPELLYANLTGVFNFILPSIFHIILSFILLGICASDFLCSNVATITDSRNQSTTGTLMSILLSWCNSSPDLFSTFISWTSSSPKLIAENDLENSNAILLSIGEVIGACGIILCVVIGSIFIIISNVHLDISDSQRFTILIDLVISYFAIYSLFTICYRNKINFLDCIVMLTLYLIYLFTKLKLKHTKDNSSSNRNNVDQEQGNIPNANSYEVTDDEGNFPSYVKPNIITAMDFNNLLSILENSTTSSIGGSSFLGGTELITLEERPSATSSVNMLLDTPSSRPASAPTIHEISNKYSDNLPTIYNPPNTSPGSFAPYYDTPKSNTPNKNIITTDTIVTTTLPKRKTRLRKFKKSFNRKLLPHLANFNNKSKIDKFLSIITIPFVIILRLSAPQFDSIIDYNTESKKFNYYSNDLIFLLIQSIICPIFTQVLLFSLIAKKLSLIFWIINFIIISILLILTLNFIRKLIKFNKFSLTLSDNNAFMIQERETDYRNLETLHRLITVIFLAIGIINSILWIAIFANSLIEILEKYQEITGISKAILGLTIFAWGNSISDLLSNIAMCKLYKKLPEHDQESISKMATKFFIISCGSCLGGVLLNSMGGIGFSALISILFVKKYNDGNWWFLRSIELVQARTEAVDSEIDSQASGPLMDKKFLVSCIFITLQIIYLGVFFGSPKSIRKKFVSNMKFIGISMCSIWGIATLINVILEVYS
ncbi:hypothetical protein TBLA_0F02820 [Henningerozyma blattae CBS 6284]|uniref:Sodium/calcium exchanger membrane region domain-containing protein n=1 Tax=Henningerozyma blattae (strain ATCC 34711 / CBS 6284 / DSM 70876 / NBRC 10599 / NRRL Y-10934 / UCD 77-7) TaxID=1071380 RepID=I2H619_HENB6|nr:hypothetical protein TBLA_0F02820 [Tetrapisispora blattae CBS 6284]CCH61821.1 hypothetical protein TBLA_0F02820 [Tetrapisispora blattae CBS 6284]